MSKQNSKKTFGKENSKEVANENEIENKNKIVKVTGLKSSLLLLEHLLKQSQQGVMTESRIKLISYLIQTYSSIRKAYKEEIEIAEIIDFELMKHRNELSILLGNWRTILQAKLGDELYSNIYDEYVKILESLDLVMISSRQSIKRQIKNKTVYKVPENTRQSSEYHTEVLKSIWVLLPEEHKKEVFHFIEKNR